jgi:hypothetical protein
MSTSYKISESVNFQTVLWDTARFIAYTARTLIAIDRRTATWRNNAMHRLHADAFVVLPALGAVLLACLRLLVAFCGFAMPIVGRALLTALPWLLCGAVVGCGLLTVFAFPAIAGCVAIIVAFAVVTYPKGA